jgi:hypothetical protein
MKPGRKKKFNWSLYTELLESEKSHIQVAKIIGCSPQSVGEQRAWMQAGFPTGERQNEGLSSYITGRER